jgi:hypothetical protein
VTSPSGQIVPGVVVFDTIADRLKFTDLGRQALAGM